MSIRQIFRARVSLDIVEWVLLTALFLVVVLAGCAHTPEGPDAVSGAGPRVINCASRAVGENWTRAYPEVMKCLTVVLVNPVECLDAVPTAVKVGIDVVACIVRDTAKTAGMQAENPGADAVTVRKAERSRVYLDLRAFEFSE